MSRPGRYLLRLLGALAGLVLGFGAMAALIGERGHLPLPSTRRLFAEYRHRRQPFVERLHGYIYARWPYLYIGAALRQHLLAKGVARLAAWLWPASYGPGHTIAETYHGKIVPLAAATQLVTIEEDIALTNLEHVIPFPRARDIILQNPDHIVVLDCPCRVSRENPCLPLDVCLIIGEPFASFVLEHHPNNARRITQQEAVEILRAEDERGHVHHAFFKEAMLDRFYAICNCCACCCGAMHAWQNGIPMVISSGYVAQVDSSHCIGCGECTKYCQFDALSCLDNRTVVEEAACMGCGICVSKCKQGAISLRRAIARGEPLEIQKLLAEMPSAPR